MSLRKVSLEAVGDAAEHVYPYFLLDEKTKKQILSMDFAETNDQVGEVLDFIHELLNTETFTIAVLASLAESLGLDEGYQGSELMDLKNEIRFADILEGIAILLFPKLQQYQVFALEHASGRLFPEE